MLFDSHAHINEGRYSEEDRLLLLKEVAENRDLAFVCDIGYDLQSSVRAAESAGSWDKIIAAVGVHPHDSGSMTEEIYEEIKSLAGMPGVKAIGEIGLDYHYMRSPKEDQRYWFKKQIGLANELKMPIVIHSREADRETMDILIEEGAFSEERCAFFPKRIGPGGIEEKDARVDIHCFSGSAELASEYVKLGASIGICGPVTFKNNKKTVRVVEEIPIEYLLVETDAPYLAPEPKRGRENRPWYVEHTARRVAVIKGISYEEACERTLENGRVFYGLV